jgi:hypothetical protein
MFLSTLFPNIQVPNMLQDNDFYVTYSLFTQLTDEEDAWIEHLILSIPAYVFDMGFVFLFRCTCYEETFFCGATFTFTQDTTVALHLPLNEDDNKNHFQSTVIFTLKPQELDKVQTVLDNVSSPTSNFKLVLNWFIPCSSWQNSLCPFFKNHLQIYVQQNLLSRSLITSINFIGYHWYYTEEPGSLGLHSVQVRCWT